MKATKRTAPLSGLPKHVARGKLVGSFHRSILGTTSTFSATSPAQVRVFFGGCAPSNRPTVPRFAHVQASTTSQPARLLRRRRRQLCRLARKLVISDGLSLCPTATQQSTTKVGSLQDLPSMARYVTASAAPRFAVLLPQALCDQPRLSSRCHFSAHHRDSLLCRIKAPGQWESHAVGIGVMPLRPRLVCPPRLLYHVTA